MATLQQRLKAVHDELTRLLAESKLDSQSKKALAKAVNEVLAISQGLSTTAISPRLPIPIPARAKSHRSLTKRAIDFLARMPALMEYIVKRWPNDNDGT